MKHIKSLSSKERPFDVMMWCHNLNKSGCTQEEFTKVFGKDLAETFSTIATSRDVSKEVCNEFCSSISAVKPDTHDLAFAIYDKFMDFPEDFQITTSDKEVLSKYFDVTTGMT